MIRSSPTCYEKLVLKLPDKRSRRAGFGPLGFFHWSPDGRTIACCVTQASQHGWSSPIILVDVATGVALEGSPGPMIYDQVAWRKMRP